MHIVMLLFKDIHYDARVQREAKALAEAGHRVLIACLREFDFTPPFIHDRVCIERIAITTKRIKRLESSRLTGNKDIGLLTKIARIPVLKPVKDLMSSVEYYQAIRLLLYENKHFLQNLVIHCHDLNTLPMGLYLQKNFGGKLIYDSHELYNEMAGKNALEKKIGYFLEKCMMPRVDHLITVNEIVAHEFEVRYGYTPTTIVQNVQDFQTADLEIKNENYFKKKYQLSERDVLLIYQGGMTPERGIEECIESLLSLPESYKLILLGSGRAEALLREQINKLGLSHRAFFHPQVPASDVLWYTKQADIGLVMYKNTCQNNYLSTPNKVFEYLAAGIPTIASNHPGKTYIVEKERTGICVKEDPKEIACAVIHVHSKYDYYKNNCLSIRNRYSWTKEKKGLVNLYRNLYTKDLHDENITHYSTLSS